MRIPKAVTIFKDLSAELGEPNKSLFVAKLDKPVLSRGTRKKIITIKKTLIINPSNFNIELEYLKNFLVTSYFLYYFCFSLPVQIFR